MEEKIKKLIDWLDSQPIENWKIVNPIFDNNEFFITNNNYLFLINSDKLSITSDCKYYEFLDGRMKIQSFVDPCINDLYHKLYKYHVIDRNNKQGEELLNEILTKMTSI